MNTYNPKLRSTVFNDGTVLSVRFSQRQAMWPAASDECYYLQSSPGSEIWRQFRGHNPAVRSSRWLPYSKRLRHSPGRIQVPLPAKLSALGFLIAYQRADVKPWQALSPSAPRLERDQILSHSSRRYWRLGAQEVQRQAQGLPLFGLMASLDITVHPNADSQQRARNGGSTYSVSPIAQAAIAKDLEEQIEGDLEDGPDNGSRGDMSSDSDDSTLRRVRSGQSYGRSMVGSYRRASFTAGGLRATVGTGLRGSSRQPTKSEKHEARREERSLLRDNNVIPPKHPQRRQTSKALGRRISQILPSIGVPGGDRKVVPTDQEAVEAPSHPPADSSETAPLLGNPDLPYGGQDSPRTLDKKWEVAVMEGKIKTTWQREAKVIGRYSAPLIITFLLQYSLTVASIFTVGHLGKVELGAVSLASMTANITGYAIYQGLATSLDTLCAQAYGSGHKKLVGLQMQRMVYFLCVITIPIGVIWLSAGRILERIVPEKDVARKRYNHTSKSLLLILFPDLAGQYLRIILIGAPGYAFFESGKRYLQAQGLFSASLYVLLICAPLNAVMNWLFVWVNFLFRLVFASCYYRLCLLCHPAISVGLRWGSYRRRSHGSSVAPSPPFVRSIRCRSRMLARADPSCMA